jgi:hypothetical protein
VSTLPSPPPDPVFYGKPLKFYPASHRYKWGEEWVPSVTTIINRLSKEHLIRWSANMAVDHIRAHIKTLERLPGILEWEPVLEEARTAHDRIKKAAGDVGTDVHHYAKLTLEGKAPTEPLDGPAQKAIKAFWQWVEQHKIEPIAVERRIMSEVYAYAGTCDFFGYIDGRLSVLDFKTGKGVYDEAWWQTSGYVEALCEELPRVCMDVPIRWIVHLDKLSGEMTAHCRDSLADWTKDRAVWRSLVLLDKCLRSARKHGQEPRKRAA